MVQEEVQTRPEGEQETVTDLEEQEEEEGTRTGSEVEEKAGTITTRLETGMEEEEERMGR